MFTLEVYQSSVTSGAVNQVTSVYSGVVPTLNSGFQCPTLHYLMGVAGVGAHTHRFQAQAPSLRPFPYPDFMPVNVGTAIESPVKGVFMPSNPIPLNYTEEVDMFAYTGTTETTSAAIIFSDGPVVQAANQRTFTVHATSSTTLVVSGWTSCALTLDQALPAEVYSLVGARAYSAHALYFKVIPAMGPLWTPGSTAVQTYDALDAPGARYGGWGTWLTFQQNVLPSVSFYSFTADTAEEVWFDLQYAGAGLGQQSS
jgi:hypothetical protein